MEQENNENKKDQSRFCLEHLKLFQSPDHEVVAFKETKLDHFGRTDVSIQYETDTI